MVIACIISFVVGALIMMCTICIVAMGKDKEPINKVHFYVARDKDGGLYLYMGKPIRISDEFIICYSGNFIEGSKDFINYGLNENDYANLKWEDEPLEVFVNMED